MLAVADEQELLDLWHVAAEARYCVAAFREPDLGCALTALALEPGAKRLVRRVPLALPPRGEVRT